MLSLNGLVSIVFVMVMSAFAPLANAEVLELGESQLHGKKDQPEAMTFVSRAPLDMSESLDVWKPATKIQEEVSRGIFDIASRN